MKNKKNFTKQGMPYIILFLVSYLKSSNINLFTNASYNNIFINSIRIYFANLVTLLYSLLLNNKLYYYLKIMKNNILISNLFSTIIIQFIASIIFCLVGYCCYGIYRVHNHWWKSDERGVVQYWYDKECSNELTLVDFKQRLTFLYYLQENDAYDSEYLDSVYFNLLEESVEYSIEEWIAYIDESMGIENLPKKFYLSTGYYNNLVQALEQLGYHAEDLIDTTTEFYLLSKE